MDGYFRGLYETLCREDILGATCRGRATCRGISHSTRLFRGHNAPVTCCRADVRVAEGTDLPGTRLPDLSRFLVPLPLTHDGDSLPGAAVTPRSRVHSSDLSGTTVDAEFDAVDEARVVGSEEESYGCDLFRTAHLAARNEGFEPLLCLGAEWVEDRRVDSAGAEDVHANSSLLKLDQPGTCEGAHSGFTGAVDAERREALDARDGAVEEDRAVVVEKRQRLLNGEERTAHVEAENLVEVLFGDLFERGP